MRLLYRSLYFQVIVAITLGVILGAFFPSTGAAMKPLGDGFIKLVKMIIAPVIFCTVVTGIAGTEDLKKVGKTGGLGAAVLRGRQHAGADHWSGCCERLSAGSRHERRFPYARCEFGVRVREPGQDAVGKRGLLHIIPDTIVEAFAQGEILQVLLIAVLFGVSLQRLGARKNIVFEVVERISEVLFAIVGIIMKLAPVGAFGAMAFTVGAYGIGSLLSLAKLMGTFYLTCVLFILVVLGTIARLNGFRIIAFLRYIREEILIVLATSSSEAALPRMIAKLESLGAGKSTVGLVIPTGYSFNLDGTSIYLTMAAIFIAQATNAHMSLTQQLTLLAVLLLTSKGAAGVTGSGFIVLAATLSAVGHIPVASLALILGIDRFMSEARAITNVIGNGVATLVIARWTDDLDVQTMQARLLQGRPALDTDPVTDSALR